MLNLDPASVTLTVSAYACQTGVPTDAIENYATGTIVLQNLGNGYYQLNWKTLSSYANSCRKLTLKIGDWSGDGFTALFQHGVQYYVDYPVQVEERNHKSCFLMDLGG